jgi:WD40 repeat protein
MKIPRRFFQYRLRTLLLVMTLLAVLLSQWTYHIRLTPNNISGVQRLAVMAKDIFKFRWSPDGQRVAFIGWEKPVEIRSVIDFWKLTTIDDKLIGFAFSRDPDVVACCKNGPNAEIRNLRSGKIIKLATKNDQPDLAFSPDGKFLATGGYGNCVYIWSVLDGSLLQVLDTGPKIGGLHPVFSFDGKILAVGNRNSTTCLFDVASGKLLHELSFSSTQELLFDPTGQSLAVAYVNGDVRLWDVATGELLHTLKTGAEEVYTLDWSPDGKMLAVAGLKGDILVLNGQDLAILNRLSGPEWVVSVKFSPDGSRLLTAGGKQYIGEERWIEVWRSSPDVGEKVLVVLKWILITTLLVLVVVAPLVRWLVRMYRSSNDGVAKSATE